MDRADPSLPPFDGLFPSLSHSPPAADNAAPGDQHSFMTIKLVEQQQNETHLKIKPITKLSELIDVYCERQGLNKNTLRFYFDQTRIAKTDTPLTLEMVDGDAVHVFAQQLGGGLLLFHSLDSSFSPPSESLSDATTLAPRIVICTVDATEESVFFKIRPTAKLEKLMNAYCEFKDKDLCTLRFLFNGKCFNADDTAHGLGMEAGDLIEVLEDVAGGRQSTSF